MSFIPAFTSNRQLDLLISVSFLACICYYLGVFDGKVKQNRLSKKERETSRMYQQEDQLQDQKTKLFLQGSCLDELEIRVANLEKSNQE